MLTRLASGLDVQPLLNKLVAVPELWNISTLRQDYPGSAHHDTKAIMVRGPKPNTLPIMFNDIEAVSVSSSDVLQPEVGELVDAVLAHIPQAGKLGRVMLVNLKAGGSVDRHEDQGRYAETYTRFHVPLVSEIGNEFLCGEQTQNMNVGELWWFNHRIPHEVHNKSLSDRIHLIVDVISNTPITPQKD